jgi:hypothetical protein
VGQWHDFFLADPGSGLTGRVAEALILLVAVLTASCLLLVPGQGTTPVGAEVLAVGLAAWGWVLAIQLLRLRAWRTMGPGLRRAFVLRAALAQAATLPFVAAGIAVSAGVYGGSTGWRRTWSSRSSWRCSARGCCSSRSTARREVLIHPTP